MIDLLISEAKLFSWILSFPHSPVPNVYNGIQSAVIKILHPVVSASDMPSELVKKLKVTLGVDLFRTLCFPHDWFTNLENVFESAPIFLKVCWLKAISGAWCTTVRMGGVSTCRWQCIFGCIDAEDVLTHYLECPVLWQFAREALRLQEDSIFLLSRLCIVEPSICKLRLLAFTHCLYHALKNDPRGVKANGFPVSPNSMQILASEISRSIRYTIPGVTA